MGSASDGARSIARSSSSSAISSAAASTESTRGSACQLPGVELRGVLPPRPVDLGLTHRLLDRSGNTLRDPLLEFE